MTSPLCVWLMGSIWLDILTVNNYYALLTIAGASTLLTRLSQSSFFKRLIFSHLLVTLAKLWVSQDRPRDLWTLYVPPQVPTIVPSPPHQASCVNHSRNNGGKDTESLYMPSKTSRYSYGDREGNFQSSNARKVCDIPIGKRIVKLSVLLGGGQFTSWFLVWEPFKGTHWETACFWGPLILFQIKLNGHIHCGRDGTWPRGKSYDQEKAAQIKLQKLHLFLVSRSLPVMNKGLKTRRCRQMLEWSSTLAPNI